MGDPILLALGGTISMVEDDRGVATPALGAHDLATLVPGIAAGEDVAKVGGSEVGWAVLHQLTERLVRVAPTVPGVIVTTGTDSIEELGAWLTWTGPWPCPVVVTGSMVPGATPGSDAAANLADAVAVTRSPVARHPVLAFAGEVFAAVEVLKVSGTARRAFAAPGRGPVAVVAAGGVRQLRRPAPASVLGPPPRTVRSVPLLVASCDDDGAATRALGRGQPAVVIAANGAGNLPLGMAGAVGDLIDAGVVAVLTSRTPDATVAATYGYPGGSAGLAGRGVVLAPGLSPHRARVLVALALAHGHSGTALRTLVRHHVEVAA